MILKTKKKKKKGKKLNIYREIIKFQFIRFIKKLDNKKLDLVKFITSEIFLLIENRLKNIYTI